MWEEYVADFEYCKDHFCIENLQIINICLLHGFIQHQQCEKGGIMNVNSKLYIYIY